MLKYDWHRGYVLEEFHKKVLKLIEKGYELSEARGVYSIELIITKEKNRIVLASGMTLEGTAISRHCQDYTHVFLMAVTIGEKLEKEIERSEPDEAVILDAFGSEAAEAAAESLNSIIKREAVHAGFYTFNYRFSPGYADFPLSTNKDFETYLQIEEIGIKVTETYMLLPRKSITAVIPARK